MFRLVLDELIQTVKIIFMVGFAYFIWVYVGAEDLAAYWEWQWRPYTEFWRDYEIGDFFRYDAVGFTQIIYLFAAAVLLLFAVNYSALIARGIFALCIVKAILSANGTVEVAPPDSTLIKAAVLAFGWQAFWIIWEGFGLRALFRARVYGSARWASLWQLWRAGLLKKGGLFLGRSWFRDLYHDKEGHIITIGGAGGGKSTGLVIPALLELTQGSVIVTDPSGELAAITMRHRAKNSRVVLLNPFQEVFEQGTGLDFPDTGFNPLSVIDPKLSTFKADCDVLARYLMVTDRQESGSYWNDEGKTFLALVIGATVLYEDEEDRTLSFVYEMVRWRSDDLQNWLEYIVKKGHPALKFEAEGYRDIIKTAPQQWQGIIRKAATATERYAPSTPLGEHVKKNGFDAADLKREDVTIYLLVPSGQLTTALPWLNMLIGVFGLAVGRPGAARPVTLLVDEAPSLGYLPDLIPFMGQFRKVGLRVWIFTQTMAQLASQELYGETGFKAIFGLCSIKQFFSIREPELARLVSEVAGERTARKARDVNAGDAESDVGVPLIRPEKVRGLRKWRQIIIVDEMDNPIKAKLIPYFKRKRWNEIADKNPYRN